MSSLRAKRLQCIRTIFDTFLYLTAVIGLVISFTGVIYPQNTYIQCNDPYISHEFQKDTISISLLLVISLLVPALTMILFEWINFRQIPLSSPFNKGLKRTYSFFLSLLVGDLFSFFIVEILKTAVSEPRPHFMNSCSPNLTQEMCQNHWVHITPNNCSNPLQLSYRKLIDTMKSFPSGHASIGVFSAVYMTMYIQERVKIQWSKLVGPWLQLVWWSWALLCCASRVWDNKHHWWDVLFGGLIGCIAGYATVVCMCNTFKERPKENLSPEVIFPEDQERDLQIKRSKITTENQF